MTFKRNEQLSWPSSWSNLTLEALKTSDISYNYSICGGLDFVTDLKKKKSLISTKSKEIREGRLCYSLWRCSSLIKSVPCEVLWDKSWMISDTYVYLCNVIACVCVSACASNSSRCLNADNLLSKSVLPPFSVCAKIPNNVVLWVKASLCLSCFGCI